MSDDRLLDRFLKYVRIDTTALEEAGVYPSSPGQIELGRLVLEELRAMGLVDARQDEHGIVIATLPANTTGETPTIAFNAHFDTSPETTGANVQPIVIHDYQGDDIRLSGDESKVIKVADNPELESMIGHTLITTDGTTLLGADDKAGMAVILETIERLTENPTIPHGDVRVLFTCDEEIGHGVDHVDVKKLGAVACYTLDGPGAAEIDIETFSADLAIVRIGGVNIHPSIAKGKMVNAIRAAALFVDQLPRDVLAPEVTEGREGFLHPYRIEGGVDEVVMRVLLRDFDAEKLVGMATLLQKAADVTLDCLPGVSIDIQIVQQYRNMDEGLRLEPRAVDYAVRAVKRLSIEPRLSIIRGGTDGSMLTEQGLPTPNLSTGQHTPHSPLEWASLNEMEQAVAVLTELVQVWVEDQGTRDE